MTLGMAVVFEKTVAAIHNCGIVFVSRSVAEIAAMSWL